MPEIPLFTLPSADGRTISLESYIGEKNLVLVFYRVPVYLPVFVILALWFAFQIYNVLYASDDSIAWWAHVCGFIAGALLIVPLRDRRLPLFDRGVRH